MQKIERKFLAITIILIIVIIGAALYIGAFKKGVDRNSYVELITGTAYLNETELTTNKREKLKIDDIVRTVGEEALAIVEWGDGSVTRLGGNTQIQVDSLYISENKNKINISFELLNGKTWSNVVSFIPDDSYFLETFMDTEAAVRGTIFNVDLDNNYLYVIESQVELTNQNNGEKVLVEEKKPLELSSFKFIRLEEFIKDFRDTSFDTINRALDSELYRKMQDDLLTRMKGITDYATIQVQNLTDGERGEIYQRLLSTYQDMNFLDTRDENLYNQKIGIKEKLIEVAPENDKKLLLDSLVSDFTDSINLGDYEVLNSIIDVLKKNANDISESAKGVINEYTNKIEIPQGLVDAFKNNINDLKNIFKIGN